MAVHLNKAVFVQSVIKGLNQLNLTVVRNTHTTAFTTSQVRKLPLYLTVNKDPAKERQIQTNLQSTLPELSNICSAFNIIEITDRLKPPAVVETPRSSDIDNSISNPLSTIIKPIESPKTHKTTIESPSNGTPKSASKNGNMYVLRLKKRKRKLRQLQKVQAKVWPIKKKIVFLRNQRKERQIREKCNMYNKFAEDYDVMEEIKRDLEEAKKQGYKYDMFGPDAESFGFGIPKPEVKSLGDHLKMMKEKKKSSQ